MAPGDMLSILNASVMTMFMDLAKATREVKQTGTDPMMLELLKAQGEMMRGQAELQMKFMEMMVKGAGEGGNGRKEMLEEMAAIKALVIPAVTRDPSDPMQVMKATLETVRSLREASDEFHPAEERGDPLTNALPKLAEILAEEQRERTRQREAGQLNPPKMRRVPVVGPLPPPEAMTANLPTPEPVPMWKRILLKEGPRLVQLAAADVDPESVADLALAMLPAQLSGVVKEFFGREDREALLVETVPGLGEFAEWRQDFVGACRVRLGLDPVFTDEEVPGVPQPAEGELSP